MNVQGVIQGDAAPQPVVFFAGLLNSLDIPDDVLRQGVGFDDLQGGVPPKEFVGWHGGLLIILRGD